MIKRILFIVMILLITGTVQAQVQSTIGGAVSGPGQFTLTVTKSGTGTGSVLSTPSGINCGVTCSFSFNAGSTITLTATPDAGSEFVQWTGGATDTNPIISVSVTSNKTIDSEFFAPAKGEFLVGWYKFNEGGGTVVNNYAVDGSSGGGPLPNLAVVENDGIFWSFQPGFGSTAAITFGTGDGLNDFAWASTGRDIGGANKAQIGGFFKRRVATGNVGGYGITTRSLHTGGTQGVRLFTCNSGASQGYLFQWGGSNPTFAYDGALINVWLFHFFDSTGKYRIVKPDGTVLVSAATANLAVAVNIDFIMFGGDTLDAASPTKCFTPGGNSYGDFLIYNQTTLTLTEWGQIYDSLRGRYGMAARSGW